MHSLSQLAVVPRHNAVRIRRSGRRSFFGGGKDVALFEAQEKMRTAKDQRGRPKYRTRDWAAWVLVGEE